MDYNNPGALLPNNGWTAQSALGGFLGGLGVGNYQDMQERNVRDSDLGFLEKLNNYEMLKAQNPAKLAQTQLAFNQANTQNQLYDNTQLPYQAAESGAKAQVAQNQAATSDNQLKQFGSQAIRAKALSDDLKTNPITPGLGFDQKRWDDIRNNYPDMNLPKTPDAGDINLIHTDAARMQSVINSPQYQQEIGLVNARAAAEMPKVEAQEKGAYARTVYSSVMEYQRSLLGNGRAVEEARAAYGRGEASDSQRRLIAMDNMNRMAGPVMSSVMGKLAALADQSPGGMAKNITNIMDEMSSGIMNGGGAGINPQSQSQGQQPQGGMNNGLINNQQQPQQQQQQPQSFSTPQDAAQAAVNQPEGWTTIVNGQKMVKVRRPDGKFVLRPVTSP